MWADSEANTQQQGTEGNIDNTEGQSEEHMEGMGGVRLASGSLFATSRRSAARLVLRSMMSTSL